MITVGSPNHTTPTKQIQHQQMSKENTESKTEHSSEMAAIHIKRLSDELGAPPYAIFESLIKCGMITEDMSSEMAQYFTFPVLSKAPPTS